MSRDFTSKRIRYTGDALSDFADTITDLIPQVFEMQYKDKIRQEDLELKEKWRKEDSLERQTQFDNNQWLVFNQELRKEIIANIDTSNDDYEELIKSYEQTSGMVSNLKPLNVTEELHKFLAIETDNALEESQLDINQGIALVNNIDSRASEIKQRLKLMDSVASYMVYEGKGSRAFQDEPLVSLGAVPSMWSNEDFEHLINDMTKDQEFLKANGLWNDEDSTMVRIDWFDDYLERLQHQPDERLASMNVQLFDNILKENEVLSKQYSKDILKTTWDAEANPQNEWYRRMGDAVDNFENINKVLMTEPNFDVLFNNGLAAAKNYETNLNSTNYKDFKTNTLVQIELTRQMLQDGFISKSRITNSDAEESEWIGTIEDMQNYQDIKLHAKMAQEDPLVMILGASATKNTFVSSKLSALRYGSHLADAIEELDVYLTAVNVASNGGTWTLHGEERNQQAAKLYTKQTEYLWAQRLGLPPHISQAEFKNNTNPVHKEIINYYNALIVQKKNEFGKLLVPLLGADENGDVDMLDNPYMDQINKIYEIRNNTRDMFKTNEKSNTGDSKDIGMGTNREDADIELGIAQAITSCNASGGTWMSAVEVCDTQGLSKMDFSTIDESTQIDMSDPNLMVILDQMIADGEQGPVTGPEGNALSWAGKFSTGDLTGSSLDSTTDKQKNDINVLKSSEFNKQLKQDKDTRNPIDNPKPGDMYMVYEEQHSAGGMGYSGEKGNVYYKYFEPGTDRPYWFTGDYDGWEVVFGNVGSDRHARSKRRVAMKGARYYDVEYGVWLQYGEEAKQFYKEMNWLKEYEKNERLQVKYYGDE